MRSARASFLLCVFQFAASAWGQQTQSSTTPLPASKDPQAVNVVNQALSAAGGTAAIKAIADYTATGNITYHWNPEVQGSVTVRGSGFDEFRLDANLPDGMLSWAISEGVTTKKDQKGTISRMPPAYPVPSAEAFPYQSPMLPGALPLPYRQLLAVLDSSQFSLTYKGIVQIDSRSAHDIQVQRVRPGNVDSNGFFSEYHTRDFFIDSSTLQVLMVQDVVPKHIVHQIRYSNYALVNGVLAPFSINEQMGGQQTWAIHLSQIKLNTGLQASDFALR